MENRKRHFPWKEKDLPSTTIRKRPDTKALYNELEIQEQDIPFTQSQLLEQQHSEEVLSYT